MRPALSFFLTFIISLIVNYLIISTGYWYLEIISGAVFSVIFCKRILFGFLSTFLSGIFAVAIYIYPLIQIGAMSVLNVTGEIAGVNGSVLLVLMLLISGLLSASGSLITIPFKVRYEEAHRPQ